MSSRKGRRLQPVANHLKSEGQLLVTMATASSRWFDDWWYEDNPAGGSKALAINWHRDFAATELQDPRCRSLISSARRLVYAMRHSTSVKKGSLRSIFGGSARKLLHLVAWMYRNTIWSFSELTPEIADWYKSDLLEAGPCQQMDAADVDVDEEGGDGSENEMSVAVLSSHLRVMIRVFELSHEFEAFPELRIPEHPFRGQSAKSLAESLAISSDGWIPRVPDEVLNPLMKEVLNWIDLYAEDVLSAQNAYLEAMDARREFTGKNYAEFTDPALLKIVFDGGGALPEPWRHPFLPSMARRAKPSTASDPGRGPSSQLRQLINDLESACSISIQALTGVRVSELLAAKAEPRQSNGWPACLIQRASRSGLFDLFYFASRTFKNEEDAEGREFEWLLGVRPAGSDMIPIAARGILILDKLFRPWRERFQTDYLSLSLGGGGGLPLSTPKAIKPLRERQARGTRSFVERHVALPREYAEWNITSHQYRKAFCQDIIRINPKALPAVQEHYGHASEYLTDEAYAGNDATMLKLIDDVAIREAARTMVDRIYGGAPLGGKMADRIDARADAIRALLQGEDTNERRISALANAISVDGIVLFTSDYLDCFFRPQHAMCHRELLGFFDKSATKPLRAFRTKKNCSVCANGLISRHHIPYWVSEYRENERIRRANEAAGDTRTAAVAAARAVQARSVLKRIGSWPIHDEP